MTDRRREHMKVHWQVGYVLDTAETRRWSTDQIAKTQAVEKTLVFAYFTPADRGCGRVLLYACETAAEAKEMVSKHNRGLTQALASKSPEMLELWAQNYAL